MILPSLNTLRRTAKTLDRWPGLNRTHTPPEGAFEAEENLCSAAHPALTARPARSQAEDSVTEIFAKSSLATVKAGSLYYGGNLVCALSTGPKQLVGLGAWLLVWPDKIGYNTADGTVKKLEAAFTAGSGVTASLCTLSGAALTPTVSAAAPASPAAGAYWLDTGGEEDVLKLWDANAEQWQAVATSYVKLAAAGIGKDFAAYDTVKIAGMTGTGAEALNSQPNTTGLTLPDRVVYARGNDYLIVAALIRAGFTSGIAVSREVPNLDYLTESDNRVWGCSSARNELLCCRPGDATNWYRYLGTADDSYAATVGSDGPFTGAATHLGYVLFFKEDCIHKIYGSLPSKYQVVTTRCRGVQAGSENSLALVNETLYYQSRDGLCAYDGSLPQKISAALGEGPYTAAAAGSWGDELFVSLTGPTGSREILVYDTLHGVWNREDGLNVIRFARCGGVLYGLGADGKLWALRGGSDTETVHWYGQTAPLGRAVPDAQYVERVQLRLQLAAGSRVNVKMACDGRAWETLADLRSPRDQSLALPLRVRRCDTFKLRLEGEGPFVLHSLTLITAAGAEVRWR